MTETPAIPVVLVAALARGGVIGRDGGLPWTVRADLRHFRALTWGKPLVMGRRTFASIGRALPGRETIVLTRDPAFRAEGVETAPDLGSALGRGRAIAAARGAEAVIVAGGAAVYAQAIALADRLVLTELDLVVEGDARFPAVDPALWIETARETYPRAQGDDCGFDIVTRERLDRPARTL